MLAFSGDGLFTATATRAGATGLARGGSATRRVSGPGHAVLGRPGHRGVGRKEFFKVIAAAGLTP